MQSREAKCLDWLDPACFIGDSRRTFEAACGAFSDRLGSSRWEPKRGILLVEEKPVELLAQLAVCITREIPVFLGSPLWKETEWAQLEAQGFALQTSGPLEGTAIVESSEDIFPGIFIPTGGSSGAIKFACHSLKTLSSAARALSQFFGDVAIHSWSSLPAYHVSGLMPWIRVNVSGGKVYYGKDAPNVSIFPDTGIKTTSIVGTHLARALDRVESASLKTYDIVFIGGSPVQKKLLDQARTVGIPLAPCYGSTETAAMISCLKPEEFLNGQLNAGKLLPHASAKTDDASQIEIDTTSLFLGYWDSSARSFALPIEPRRRWMTDDLGSLDSEGYLHIHGRADRLIISGGEKVDPVQVEAAIISIEGVRDAWIVAEEHSEWGAQIVCILNTDTKISQKELTEILKPKLSTYKIPKRWIFTESMPYTPHGKRDKGQITSLLNTQNPE